MFAQQHRPWMFNLGCLIAGAVASLAFAPYQQAWLIIPSLAVLFFCLYQNRDNPSCFAPGYCYGLGFFGFGIHWLYISINLFGGVNLLGAYAITAVMIAIHALYPALFCFIVARCYKTHNTLALLFIFPAAWTLIEWSRSWMFTGFPWLSIGYTQTDTLLAAYASIAGVYGIGFIIALLSCALMLLFISTMKDKLIIISIATLCIVSAYVFHNIEWTNEKDKTISVALIQASIPQEQKWQQDMKYKTVEIYRDLTQEYWEQDLIVWPETAMPFFYHDEKALMEELSNHAINTNTELLIGIPYSEPASSAYYNSVISIGPSTDIYLKRHLVPFGEYLPFDDLIRPVLYFLKIPMSSFSAGTQTKPIINVLGEDIGLSICYEDVFGEEVIQALPEASLLVNVSNDAWFGDSAAPHQHLQMARMRSIETGRYMLRATNNGISAIIDQKGNITAISPQFEPHALSAEAKLFTGQTPYSYTGNYAIVFISSLILALGLLFKTRKK